MADRNGMVALADGGRIAYEVRGSGPPLLICRWGTGSMALWHAFAAPLERTRQVIAFDPRGAGRSSDAPLGSTTRGMARDAVALLDALDVSRADLFGESLGGMTASWIAIDEPTRVDRLVLASTLPELSALSPRAVAQGLGYARCILRPAGQATVCLVRKMMAPHFCEDEPERMAAIEAELRHTPTTRRNLLALALAALRHRAASALHLARAPTLLLFGELDPIVGRASREELCRERPGATVEVIAGVGHALTLERPQDVAERVIGFLT